MALEPAIEPDAPVKIIVEVLAVIVPKLLVSVPPIVVVEVPKSFAPAVLHDKLLKVGVPEIVCAAPFNVTVFPVTRYPPEEKVAEAL